MNYTSKNLISFHTVERIIESVGKRLLFLKDAQLGQSFFKRLKHCRQRIILRLIRKDRQLSNTLRIAIDAAVYLPQSSSKPIIC